MDQDAWIIMVRRPVKREGSVQYMAFVLVSFAVSVSLTRLFLSLSNYPQVGNGELHIAHVLWGGLLLFIAALLPLLISNRRAYKAASILTGVGIGLFIDEVGKFITQKNDYFYPAAAPIIYIFFMLTLMLLLQLRRQEKATARAEMCRVLETLQDWIYNPLSQKDHQVMLERLKSIADDGSTSILSGLASGLLSVIQEDERPATVKEPPRWAPYIKGLDRWVSERGLRITLASGFLVMALIAFKNPTGALLGSRLPSFINSWLIGLHSGRWIDSESAAVLYQIRVILEIVLGFSLLMVSLFLFFRRQRIGILLGFVSLLVYLGTINMFLFYFEQFSTILLVLYQFILLLGLMYYRARFPSDVEAIQDTVAILS
jgi:hypothetical protein